MAATLLPHTVNKSQSPKRIQLRFRTIGKRDRNGRAVGSINTRKTQPLCRVVQPLYCGWPMVQNALTRRLLQRITINCIKVR